jgi:hypothetical protein
MVRLIIFMVLLSGAAVWAQDGAPQDDAANEPETETEDVLTAEELEDLDLDSQEDHTEEDEDVFKPTDVVSFEQSVNFPVDI